MIAIDLNEVAKAMGGALYPQSDNLIISRTFTDNRESNDKGGLFFAIKGEKIDSHCFVNKICQSGSAAVVSDEKYHIKNTVLVKNVKDAIYKLADYYRTNKCTQTKVIGITGSVGKTTTKDMTGLIMTDQFSSFVTEGNKNSLIGVPFSVMSIENQNFAVLELGMSERGEIAKLSMLAKPFVSVITNIGSSHIEALGSIENIKKEKFDILCGEAPDGKIVLNRDNALEYNFGKTFGDRAVFCGIENKNCDYFASDIKENEKVHFNINHCGKKTAVTLNVLGAHNIYNAMYAFAVSNICGAESEKAAESLSRFVPNGNRQNVYEKDGYRVIADCYNASPESMRASFYVLNKHAEGRKIAVLGDMLELGIHSETLHRQVGKEASETADILIFIGENADIYSSAASKCDQIYSFALNQKHEAAQKLVQILKKGDTVLFKASNRLHLEDIIKDVGL
ncbi:MAG: UDP-N-acetylmuramoyl-tripeptide--D-alanyl-D-alanine ligase [Clostridia bacterium]